MVKNIQLTVSGLFRHSSIWRSERWFADIYGKQIKVPSNLDIK